MFFGSLFVVPIEFLGDPPSRHDAYPSIKYEDMEKARDAAVPECLRFKRSCLKLEGIIKGRIQLQLRLVVKLIRIHRKYLGARAPKE